MKAYKNYRWFVTAGKKLVVGGKNAVQNDELLHSLQATKKDYYVMHTSSPGSPFSVIIAPKDKVLKQDLDECAQFTGAFSRAWKENKRSAQIDVFFLTQLSKEPSMKAGMWRVHGAIRRVNVPLKLVLTKQRGILRAVPPSVTKKPLATVMPGSVDKTKMAAAIKARLTTPIEDEALLAALPAGGVALA